MLTSVLNCTLGKGKTYAELDVLFEKRISARKFKTYVVDPFDDNDDAGLVSQRTTVA